MLLIITSESDFAADYLILRLIERNLPYVRINSEHLAQLSVSFQIKNGKCKRDFVSLNGQVTDLSEIKSVWYRRSIDPLPDVSISPAQQRFVAGELRHLWTGLVLDPTIKWVNPIEKVYVGEHKVFQLRLACQLGLLVPETLISSKADVLSEFVTQVDGAICKPIFHGLFIDGQDRYSIYTHRVSNIHLSDQSSIDLCPVFVQEEIKRSADIRVTFIGEQCFAVRITSDDPRLIDWRIPGKKLHNTIIDLNQDVKKKCLFMMQIMGLKYAAFDFIETPSGELVFLEVNPTGEWAWLEDQLGIPMRDAFIDLFYGG